MHVHVARPLAPGQELTVDYLANGDGAEEVDESSAQQASRRPQKWLQEQYRFACRCERCGGTSRSP